MLLEVIHLRFNDRTPSRFKFRAEPPRPTDPPPNEQPVAEGDGLRVRIGKSMKLFAEHTWEVVAREWR